MTSARTLRVEPLEHPALDHEVLRREGIRHLEDLIGHVWNDYNTHDPGITILEQLCYAITDLAYRASYGIPDLLASNAENPYESFHGASEVLSTEPVSLRDLRKVVLDVEGVKNAWIEEVVTPPVALHLHDSKRELRFQSQPPYTTPVSVRGLLRVLVETTAEGGGGSRDVLREVAERLHRHRPLCVDFHEVRVLESLPIRVNANIELGSVDDPERVFLDIHQTIAEYLSPSVSFAALPWDMSDEGRSDEAYDGPTLGHGFLRAGALDQMRRREAIHTSDILRELMSIPGVRAVHSISVSKGSGPPEPWSLSVDVGSAPRLNVADSEITLTRGKLVAKLDARRVERALAQLRAQPPPPRGTFDLTPPAGRDRGVADYHPIHHEMPAIYSVGDAVLSEAVTPRRRAQARQLMAYLLCFDQVLANCFAQLAHAGSLLSFHGDDSRSYFAQAVEDASVDRAGVRSSDADAPRRLARNAGDETAQAPVAPPTRRNRFLDHLLARFAEQFVDYSLVLAGARSGGAESVDERLVRDKRAFLQRYPRISAGRGTGSDLLRHETSDKTSGLQERIERKLGLVDDERFILIEHLLLAPIAQDDVLPGELDFQQVPLLYDCVPMDPYSLQLSFVFPGWRGRLARSTDGSTEFRSLAERVIREECPAHLTPYVHWFEEPDWEVFARAHTAWLDAYYEYRASKLGIMTATPPYFRVREARDRVINQLGFGATYPLRDLPVRQEGLTVPLNQVARIPIDFSQEGVMYELLGLDDSKVTEVEGNGGTVLLTTAPMQADTTFNIRARKIVDGRIVYLRTRPTVKVGIDAALPARIVGADLLEPSLDPPGDRDVRIVDWGASVRVQVDRAQEGVDYQLVRAEGAEEHALSPVVRGDLSNLTLQTEPIKEDVDLRVRATKTFDASGRRETRLLGAVLPVAVRARRDLTITVEPAPIAAFEERPSLRIDGAQTSADYTLYARPLSDEDFVYGVGAPGLLSVVVDGAPSVFVPRPPESQDWRELPGFQPVGAPTPGDAGALRLSTGVLRDDVVILVRASKRHQGATSVVSSSVQLTRAVLVLVRPDPRPALRLGVVMGGTLTTGTLEFVGGQPGVFYQARRSPDGTEVGRPAYVHKTDAHDPRANRGVEQLRIEMDLVISRGTQRAATTPTELATTPPLTPLVSTEPLGAGAVLSIVATKARTRVNTVLPINARIDPIPEVRAAQATVTRASPATIVVRASVAGERYQLTRGEQPSGPPRDGDGTDLTFVTDPLMAETTFVLLVTRPADAGVVVERRVLVVVGVT